MLKNIKNISGSQTDFCSTKYYRTVFKNSFSELFSKIIIKQGLSLPIKDCIRVILIIYNYYIQIKFHNDRVTKVVTPYSYKCNFLNPYL